MLAQAHLIADDCFVDALDRIDDTGQRFARTGSPTPSGWVRTERGGWVALHPDDVPLPRQGWKIHASATADRAEHVVDTVWDYCTRRSVSFKFLRSTVLLHHMNSKQAPRSASGKLVTIYPADEQELERTLTGLTELLGGIEGPYVLSDLRWEDGPLYVRYGGFHLAYCFAPDGAYVPAIEGPDGVLLPDVRGTSFRVPPWVEPPGFLAARIEASKAAAPGGFPYRVEKALHFSNGGGVYRAVEKSTGRRVVLREARPHAGLDDRDADAVARLAHEQGMLERLAGLDCVPALYAHVRHWEHHFLVEELIEGETLQEAVGRRHPLFRDGADEADLAAYTLWAQGVIGRVEEAVAELHARGVVFGDLQPGNIMVRPDDSVCLVDFETAFEDAEDHRPSLGTPGFTARWARSGRSVDTYGLAAVSLALFCPLTPLLRFDRDKYAQLTDWTRRRFPVPPEFTARLREQLAPPPHWPRADDDTPPDASRWPQEPGADGRAALDSLAEAIRLSATPEREDRLFPGDVRQFDHQGASLAFGAAGVLHALLISGYADDPAFEGYVDWLARSAERTRWPRPGLYDGLAGVAYVLAELGRTAEARAALDRIDGIGLEQCGAGLFGGLAGIGLARLHFGDVDAAQALGERLARVVTGGGRLPGPADAVGLTHGWSGPALLFTHLHAATDNDRWLRLAETALARDLGRCGAPREGRVQVRDGQRWLSTLDRGSAGIGLVLDAYVRRTDDPYFARVRDRIRDGLGTELLLSPGLLDGQAGLLHATAHLAGPGSALAPHLRGLGLHCVRHQGRRAFALDGLLRLSMDLATGTAGVLLAVHGALNGPPADSRYAALPFLEARVPVGVPT
ncbi:class III lanthionine synthetase LanKC [Streptomyces flavofungini]|uniref:Class III lanthionine synthetase LanKC n=1 Tax=Streptomyces flavofungini TaxID=68200 RepID=A0ABS0X7D7_9ACTN|nr:class III lanthionine synthetase LanKC [Streptomyces flavofungini]MBJ3809120.1 class III lanthionine synthetase LanKC [Streptomyces flavofungini]GHC68656.1 serine/threonine protein kinase [Streptomyces flavofungini]